MNRLLTVLSWMVLSAAMGAVRAPAAEPPRRPPERTASTGAEQLDLEATKTEIIDRDLVAREFSEEWKRICWRPSLDQALADARKEQKPLLAIFVLKEYGQVDSPMT